MPLDDRLRAGLRRIADEVDPDVERAFQRATSGRPRPRVRQAGTILSYAAVAGLGIAVIGLGASTLVNRFGTAETSSPSANLCSDPDLPTCAGPLEPGVHRSGLFVPPIDYIIPIDSPVAWDNPEDRPGTFTLHPEGPETDAIFFFRDVGVLTAACNPRIDEAVGNEAADIATWMVANPNLTATAPEAVTVRWPRGRGARHQRIGRLHDRLWNDRGSVYPAGLPIVPLFAGAGSGDLTWFVGGTERIAAVPARHARRREPGDRGRCHRHRLRHAPRDQPAGHRPHQVRPRVLLSR